MTRGRMSRHDILELACIAGQTLESCLMSLNGGDLGQSAFKETLARAERARQDVGDKIAALARRLGEAGA